MTCICPSLKREILAILDEMRRILDESAKEREEIKSTISASRIDK